MKYLGALLLLLPNLLRAQHLEKHIEQFSLFSNRQWQTDYIVCSNDTIPVLPLKKDVEKDEPYFDPRCKKFINTSGEIGPYGKYIEEYIESKNPEINSEEAKKDDNKKLYNAFMKGDLPGMVNIPNICPNWKLFKKEKKILFWVWTFASMANAESSCNSNAETSGSTGEATERSSGLYQLNKLRANRKWRGVNCKFSEEEIFNPKVNTFCALDIMSEQLLGKHGMYNANGKIYPTNSYWKKLRVRRGRKPGGSIGKLMKKFPFCRGPL